MKCLLLPLLVAVTVGVAQAGPKRRRAKYEKTSDAELEKMNSGCRDCAECERLFNHVPAAQWGTIAEYEEKCGPQRCMPGACWKYIKTEALFNSEQAWMNIYGADWDWEKGHKCTEAMNSGDNAHRCLFWYG